jgi:glycosyltransferase involved in cell wall biosynthesis
MSDRLRALYLCYLSIDDPLVETQVVAYLAGLAERGHVIHLVTFEPGRMPRARRREVRERLAARGIAWHRLTYHKRPSLPATVFDTLWSVPAAAWWMRRHRLDTVHCRSHVPAAAGLLLRRLTRCRLIFDIRGLMAEEYVDAGRWPADGIAVRITKAIERAAIRHADGIVVLTERVNRMLFGPAGDPRVAVIPCCTPLTDQQPDGTAVAQRLGLGDRPVMVYVGKFTGWYMDAEMADFFAVARRRIPGLHFLVLTQADARHVADLFAAREIPAEDFTLTRAAPEDVGAHLAVARFAIAFIRPSLSKRSSSPTKIGEYLAAGLPVLSTADVGDVDALLEGTGAGVLVDAGALDEEAYGRAADAIMALAAGVGAPEACRAVARRELSMREVGIPRYAALYERVALSRGSA